MGVCCSTHNAVQPLNNDDLKTFAISPRPSEPIQQPAPHSTIDTTDLQYDNSELTENSTVYEHKRHHTLSPTIDEGSTDTNIKLHQYKNKVACLIFTVNQCAHTYTAIHYISLLERCKQLYMPLIQYFNPLHVHTQLQRLYVVFDTCSAALHTALHIHYLTQQYNNTLHNPSYHIHITGIGIDYGDCVVELPCNKLYGVASDCALQLSNTRYMSNNTVQCSNRVKREIQTEDIDLYNTLQFNRQEQHTDYKLHDALQAQYYTVHASNQYTYTYTIISPLTDTTYLHNNLLSLTQRYDTTLSKTKIEHIDNELVKSFYTANETYILRYTLNLQHVTQLCGSLACYEIYNNIRTTYSTIIELHTGLAVDDTFAIFGNAVDAVLCCVALQYALQKYNRTAIENDTVTAIGYTLDTSHLLVIPETDVCTGKAVYVADQMLEYANGNILITDAVYSSVYEQLKLQHTFDELTTEHGKVYKVISNENTEGVVSIKSMS